jgi:hypothetical protein
LLLKKAPATRGNWAGAKDVRKLFSIYAALTGVLCSTALHGQAIGPGLVAAWGFFEGSGSIAVDSTGSGHNLTLFNSPIWQLRASCESGGCLRFTGTNQYVSVPLDLSDTNVVTVTFWLNWDAYANDDKLAMEFTSNFNNATTGFMIDPNSSTVPGKFEAGIRGNAGYNQVNFSRPSTAGWHHYAFVFNKGAPAASEVTPYVDGVPVSYAKHASAENSNNFGSDTLVLMSRNGQSQFGAGVLADVQIYNVAKTAAEISYIYSFGHNHYSYWTFDEGAGSTAADAGSIGHSVTVFGTPAWQSGASCAAANCVRFNGINQYGSVPLDFSDSDAVTVAVID